MNRILIFTLVFLSLSCGGDDIEYPTTYTYSHEDFVFSQVFVVKPDFSIMGVSTFGSHIPIKEIFESGIRNETIALGIYRLDEVELISEEELRIKGFHEDLGDFNITTNYSLQASGQLLFDDVLPDSNIPLFFNRTYKYVEACYSIKVTQRDPTPEFPSDQEIAEFSCDEFRVGQNLTLEVSSETNAIDDRIGIFISKQIFTK